MDTYFHFLFFSVSWGDFIMLYPRIPIIPFQIHPKPGYPTYGFLFGAGFFIFILFYIDNWIFYLIKK